MKKGISVLCLFSLLALPLGLATAAEEGGAAEPAWTAGTVTEYFEGNIITIDVPGENEGEVQSLSFTISDETEFYGEIVVGMKVDVEHLGNQALYIQPTEEEDS